MVPDTFVHPGYTASGQPTEIQQTTAAGGPQTIDSYVYSYLGSGDANPGLLSNVVHRESTDGGSTWTTIQQEEYTYYDGSSPYGDLGDLEYAVLADVHGNAIDTTYYRYYTSDSDVGYTDGLEYMFNNASYERLVTALGGASAVATATNCQVAPYATEAMQYDSEHRVTSLTTAGSGCSVCSAGLGTYTCAISRNVCR